MNEHVIPITYFAGYITIRPWVVDPGTGSILFHGRHMVDVGPMQLYRCTFETVPRFCVH